MIIDCFPFLNELELLELRLQELHEVVDWFVLIEASETYSGKPKPFVYAAHQEHFCDFNICHLQIQGFPAGMTNPWEREAYTRNALFQGLQSLAVTGEDLVLLSDVDEIPRAECIHAVAQALQQQQIECAVFEQILTYFYVNCVSEETWQGTRMVRASTLNSFHELRSREGVLVPNGGWQFSYLGGVQRVQEKIQSSIHTELDLPQFTDAAHIARCLQEGRDLFGREMAFHFVPLDARFPRFLREHQDQFTPVIAPCELPKGALVAELFAQALTTPSDIQGHLAYLARLASSVEYITEMGVRHGVSTSAFLQAHPQKLVSYDRERQANVEALERAAREAAIEFTFIEADVLQVTIEPTDLLFIDTWHVGPQLQAELARHADKVGRYLVFHDTETYAFQGETTGYDGIWPPIASFLRQNSQWRLWQHFPHCNGLTVLMRL